MATNLDERLARAVRRGKEWAALAVMERASLLRSCMVTLRAEVESWTQASCKAKCIDFDSPLAGEEWISGPAVTMRHLRLYAETLEGSHPLAGLNAAGDGVVQVFPGARFDSLLLSGFRAEAHRAPGAKFSQQAVENPQQLGPGGVAAVLGAGNINSIPPLDALDLLLRKNLVPVVKLNPVNEYLLPIFERAFAPLVDRGYLFFQSGGAAAGSELLNHDLVDHVHLTGSEQTYDAIVWGGEPQEQAAAKVANQRKLNKPVTAELGAVTPVLVVPGPWSRNDLQFQARHLAGMLAHNGSFNCNAPKLLVMASRWHLKESFLRHLRKALGEIAPRKAWYPGAAERWEEFARRYPQAETFGIGSEAKSISDFKGSISHPANDPEGPLALPWLFIPGVPLEANEYACQTEAFCGVLAQTFVDAREPEEFLEQAVPLVNDRVRGSLSCVIISPDHVSRIALKKAAAQLRYGGVAVNAWGGMLFGLAQPTWGAFPGHSDKDIQSGAGEVHNAFLLDGVEKTVLWAPFRPLIKPLYFPNHRRSAAVGKAWVDFELHPGLFSLMRIAIPALFP